MLLDESSDSELLDESEDDDSSFDSFVLLAFFFSIVCDFCGSLKMEVYVFKNLCTIIEYSMV